MIDRKTFFAVTLIWLTFPAAAHEWYPQECCGGVECEEVAVREAADGYYFEHPMQKGAIEFLPYGGKYRFSADDKFHVCYWRGGHSQSGTLVDPANQRPCFFIPSRGT